MRRVRPALALALVVSIVAANVAQAKPKLRRFNSCGALVDYGNSHRGGYERGGPPPPFGPPRPATGVPGPMPASGQGGAPTAAPESDSSGDFSLTNNQEAGVFEPDIVKTDGAHVFAVTSYGMLEVVDITGTPKLLAEFQLPAGYNHQLLLYKGKLLVTQSTFEGKSLISRVDVTDAAHPVLERTLTVNGNVLASRRTNGTVRVVLGVTPQALINPDQPASTPSAWVPRGTFRNVRRGTSDRRRLVGCKSIRRPRSFSGLEELTVLTIDLDKGLDPVDSDAVMTGGETVYASEQNLFVTTQRYNPAVEDRTTGPVPQGQTTQIHRFSLDDAGNTTYRGSGTIAGYVLNQFSLSEKGNVLRVASTDVPPWFTEGEPSHSMVTTLAENSDHMAMLGRVDGLGKGERIFAVRFLGDVGYVVTFRQIDPLYTVDVSDPQQPRVRGELKISGVSTYLHPLGGDRLLGVGNGPSDDGTQNGLQLSEFDVSDLEHPKLEHRVTLDGASSEAQYDHHAFLWWAPRNLALLPVTIYEAPECSPNQPCPMYAEQAFGGAIGFTVTPAGISEDGRAEQDGIVRRTMVMGDRLLTVSDMGLKASALDDYTDRGSVQFSPPPASGSPNPETPCCARPR